MIVVADRPATELVEALGAAGAFPIIEAKWSDAPTAFVAVKPARRDHRRAGSAAERILRSHAVPANRDHEWTGRAHIRARQSRSGRRYSDCDAE